MAYDFTTLDEAQAIALIAASNDPLTALEPTARDASSIFDKGLAQQVRRFLAGDHWQDGDGWVGPKPSSTTPGANDDHALSLIEDRFVSRNMIEDVTTRQTDGVLGREPAWGFTPTRALASDEEPTEKEQGDIDVIEAALTAWWDKRKCHALFQRINTEAIVSGRAVVRLYVPAARLTIVPTGDQGQADSAESGDIATPARGVVAKTLEDALDHIFVEIVISDDAAVYTDTDSMEQIGIVVYFAQGEIPGSLGPRVIETTFLGGDRTMPRDERPTVIRLVTAPAESAVELPLLGHLTHYAVVRPPLINSSIVSMQKALNLSMSMVPRNVETGGFLERTLLNAQLPGDFEEDPDTGERRFVPAHYVAGAGTTQFIQGTEHTDAQGQTTIATPDIRYREPSPVTPTTGAIDALVAEILREAKQAHILGTDQVQSGVSRVQARADFEKSLGRSQSALEPAGRWLLETVLTMACGFATDSQGIDPASYRATFTCFTDTGPLDPQEKTTVTQAVQLGILSAEWGMQALGVEDVDAETARLNSEPGKRIELRIKKAAALKAFTDAGLSLKAAAKLAGFEDDEITLIADDELQNPPPSPVPGTMQPALNPDGTPKLDANGQPVMEPIPSLPGTPPAATPNPPGVVPPALAA